MLQVWDGSWKPAATLVSFIGYILDFFLKNVGVTIGVLYLE